MRTLAAAIALACLPQVAHADSFVEVAGGIMTPVSDDQWTDYVDSGVKLAGRAGAMGRRAGGMLSLDWTPIDANDAGFGNAVDISSHRFRLLVSALAEQKLGANLTASFRLGGGFDIAYVNVQTDFFGVQSDDSDFDVGLGLEAAAGLWFDVGSVQLGGEIGLPMSFHDDGPDNNIDLEDYTSVDFDVLFGVRFVSKTPD